MEIKRINIIGFGNVGQSLFKHLDNRVKIISIYSHSDKNDLAELVAGRLTTDIKKISKSVDLNILAIKDGALQELQKLIPKSIPAVHTAGGINIDVFEGFFKCGILYPFQTFTKGVDIDISKVPFLIESNNALFDEEIEKFISSNLSKKIFFTNSNDRKIIHFSGVITNNFLTYFLSVADDMLKSHNLNLDILTPLLEETLRKSIQAGPKNSLTGPAARGDFELLNNYSKLISSPDFRDVFDKINSLIASKNFTAL